MKLFFLHLKMIHPVHLLQQHHLDLLTVHPHLQAAAVLLIVIVHLQNLQLIDEHQFILILFTMMVTFQNLKQVSINYQNGQFNF